jgi:hypothetical protein
MAKRKTKARKRKTSTPKRCPKTGRFKRGR